MKTKCKMNKLWVLQNHFAQECLSRKSSGRSLKVVGEHGGTKHTMLTNVHILEPNVKSLNTYMPGNVTSFYVKTNSPNFHSQLCLHPSQCYICYTVYLAPGN
eukprot:6791688-Karenia_brevis.AAC.1